jgi:hypothetical protein
VRIRWWPVLRGRGGRSEQLVQRRDTLVTLEAPGSNPFDLGELAAFITCADSVGVRPQKVDHENARSAGEQDVARHIEFPKRTTGIALHAVSSILNIYCVIESLSPFGYVFLFYVLLINSVPKINLRTLAAISPATLELRVSEASTLGFPEYLPPASHLVVL